MGLWVDGILPCLIQVVPGPDMTEPVHALDLWGFRIFESERSLGQLLNNFLAPGGLDFFTWFYLEFSASAWCFEWNSSVVMPLEWRAAACTSSNQ